MPVYVGSGTRPVHSSEAYIAGERFRTGQIDGLQFSIPGAPLGRITNKISRLDEGSSHRFLSEGANGTVSWRVRLGPGTIDSGGLYTSEQIDFNRFVVVDLLVNRRRVDSVEFTLNNLVDGRISNKIETLSENSSHQFEAADTTGVVTWRVFFDGSAGSISADGLYTPGNVARPVSATVALYVDGIAVDSNTFTVTPFVVTGRISNKIESINEDETHQFVAEGTSPGLPVTWRVPFRNRGSIDADGNYSPPDISQPSTGSVQLLVGGTVVDSDGFNIQPVFAPAPPASISSLVITGPDSILDDETAEFGYEVEGLFDAIARTTWQELSGGGSFDGSTFTPDPGSNDYVIQLTLEVAGRGPKAEPNTTAESDALHDLEVVDADLAFTVSINGPGAAIAESDQHEFTASIVGGAGPVSYFWTATAGTFGQTGATAGTAHPTYSPPDVSADTEVTVSLSVRRGGVTATASVTFTVTAVTVVAPSIRINNPIATIGAGESHDYSADIVGGAGAVANRKWEVVSGPGSFSATGGIYTAPTVSVPTEVEIRFSATRGGVAASATDTFTIIPQ